MTRAWTRSSRNALFVGSVAAAPSCVVVAGAAAVAGVGTVALVALFTPGVVTARIAVRPA